MAGHEQPKRAAQAQQNEALFVYRMIRVVDQSCTLIEEGRLGFFERDTVLFLVGGGLALIPLELKRAHTKLV